MAQSVGDAGFESPVQPANQWEQANGSGSGTLAGSLWTFSPSAGITRNVSAFQSGAVTAPEGQQMALIQNTGTVMQTLSGFTPGEAYSITYSSAARACCVGGNNDTNVLLSVDGQLLSGGHVLSEPFLDHTSATFVASSATPMLTLQTTNPSGGDRTLFLDNIRINSLGAVVTPTLSNPSFEAGTPSAVFPEYGVIDGWASNSQGSGTNGAGGPFLNGAPIPDGSRVGFLQRSTAGITEISQTITGLTPGKDYTIQYFENERGAGTSPLARPSTTVDGNVIVAEHDSLRTDRFRRVVSQSFTATGTTATLALRTNIGANDNTALFDNVQITRAVPVIADGGFENPVQPANQWEQANGTGGGTLAGSNWTITGGAGITRNFSAFQNGNIPAPEGSQHALIQGTGSFEQMISGFELNANYSLTLSTMARQAGSFGNDLEVILDAGLPTEEVLIDQSEILFNAFTELTSPEFRAKKDSYSLTIRSSLDGGNLTGDRTTFFDDVRFNFVAEPVPEPASIAVWSLLAGMLAGALWWHRRR